MATVPFRVAERSSSVDILGVPVWNPEYDEFLLWWNEMLSSTRRTRLLAIANAHTLNLAHERPGLHACLCGMDAIVNDGIGAAIAARLRGTPFAYNFNGTDLIPRLFAETARPLTVYLYGASEESNAGAAEAIERRFPNVRVVGRMHGFADSDLAVASIAASGADVLLVALGQPKQELFLTENRERLNVRIACGVGALFDFLSGRAHRAPNWVRTCKLEWAYRLGREPVRLFRRYVVGNPIFLARAAWATVQEMPRNPLQRPVL